MDIRSITSSDECSTEGAEHIASRLSRCESAFLTALSELREATSVEIAHQACENHGGRESVRKRAAKLVRDGTIKIVGSRRCRVTNRQAKTYCGTTLGFREQMCILKGIDIA